MFKQSSGFQVVLLWSSSIKLKSCIPGFGNMWCVYFNGKSSVINRFCSVLRPAGQTSMSPYTWSLSSYLRKWVLSTLCPNRVMSHFRRYLSTSGPGTHPRLWASPVTSICANRWASPTTVAPRRCGSLPGKNGCDFPKIARYGTMSAVNSRKEIQEELMESKNYSSGT